MADEKRKSGKKKSAKKASARKGAAADRDPTTGPLPTLGADDMGDGALEPGTTGRYLVLLTDDEVEKTPSFLTDTVGVRVAMSRDFAADEEPEPASGEAVVFESLGVAVVDAPPDQGAFMAARAATTASVSAVEPERYIYAIHDLDDLDPEPFELPEPDEEPLPPAMETGRGADYLRGYTDGVTDLARRMGGGSVDVVTDAGPLASLAGSAGAANLTWGLRAIGTHMCSGSGQGIAVAILDTGIDLRHPDMAARVTDSRSFVRGETVQDRNGHGTHCAGTAVGPAKSAGGRRYGVAPEADLYVGKVLSNAGVGTDRSILGGIQWAMQEGCEVISMSLGARVHPGQSHSRVYEQVASRALSRGCLIVAAAGNDSARPRHLVPVSHPANCPSILAVGAIDSGGRVAGFSNAGLDPRGGAVDVAAPGVGVYSSYPVPRRFERLSGTSMATPHVAGVCALFAQTDSSPRGRALAAIMLRAVRPLRLPRRDVGHGLVQVP